MVRPPSSKTLTSAGNMHITGIVGGTNALDSLTLTLCNKGNVLFDQTVTVGGNVTISSTGIVTFSEDIVISGDLIITGASQVTKVAICHDVLSHFDFFLPIINPLKSIFI